jgi:hypothetical protein
MLHGQAELVERILREREGKTTVLRAEEKGKRK